jgi:hypothetical protein
LISHKGLNEQNQENPGLLFTNDPSSPLRADVSLEELLFDEQVFDSQPNGNFLDFQNWSFSDDSRASLETMFNTSNSGGSVTPQQNAQSITVESANASGEEFSTVVKHRDPLSQLSARTLCRLLLGNEEDANKISIAFSAGNVNLRDIIMAGVSAVGYSPNIFQNSGNFSGFRQSTFPANPVKGSRLSLPDPHSKFLTISRVNIMSACLENARMMGISSDSAVEPNRESPFHEAFLSSDLPSTIAQFSYLKPDLRPSIVQIQNSHFLWVDVLPFPEFRDRLLSLRQAGPGVFDESELCHDIDEGGIICWGRNEGGGCGRPWDRRNWEMRPEFLKKWWMLTGGPDGELWKQSRWWAETRGEE